MKAYLLRRLLLIPPTLLGITLLIFLIMRLVPGGPMEEDLKKSLGQGEQKTVRSREQSGVSLKPSQLIELAEKHHRDQPAWVGYGEWLGLLPRIKQSSALTIQSRQSAVEIPIPGSATELRVVFDSTGQPKFDPTIPQDVTRDWKLRVQTVAQQQRIWQQWMPAGVAMPANTPERLLMYQESYDGLLQGSLGESTKYQEPVLSMILQKMPISLFYGGIEILLIYGICLPLGIVKAIHHRTWFDNLSSILVFAGHAIPGYALGAFLVVYVCAHWGWFPIGGFHGDSFADLSFWGKVRDLLYHAAMPLLCYLVGGFAVLTMMMKNSLMDHLAADYVRTAIAKGNSFHRAVFFHACRNAIIPIATTIGGNVSILVAGSMLIEKIFDINGAGLMQFNALLERDEPVIMGTLALAAFLMLIGNVISDFAVAIVDPNITFE